MAFLHQKNGLMIPQANTPARRPPRTAAARPAIESEGRASAKTSGGASRLFCGFVSFFSVLSSILGYSGQSAQQEANPTAIRISFTIERPMRRPISFASCFLALTLFPLVAGGEVFVLKSGGRIEGDHLNRNREPGQPYQLRTEEGVQLQLADSAVQRVIAKTDLDKQYEALVAKTANTVEGQWGLAEWCKEAGMSEQRKRHLQAVIAIDPNHVDARKALGYQRYGSRWQTQEEHMQSLGYVKYKGAWRTKQEIEIENRDSQDELATKKLRRDIFRWFEQVATGGRNADAADRELNALRDPQAAPALAEIVGNSQEPPAIRKRALEILARMPPGIAAATLASVAMNDADGSVRDACLDELKRQGTHAVLPAFVRELRHKDNSRVNRAAECLARLGDKDATLPLINALVTEHRFQVQQGGPPGGMSATFSPSGGPGSGGLGMGNKTVIQKRKLENAAVRGALTSLYPGVNHQYNVDAWRAWYAESQNSSLSDLRRDE